MGLTLSIGPLKSAGATILVPLSSSSPIINDFCEEAAKGKIGLAWKIEFESN